LSTAYHVLDKYVIPARTDNLTTPPKLSNYTVAYRRQEVSTESYHIVGSHKKTKSVEYSRASKVRAGNFRIVQNHHLHSTYSISTTSDCIHVVNW
jgi:hypothetical protein